MKTRSLRHQVVVLLAILVTASSAPAQRVTVTVTPTVISEGEDAIVTFTLSQPNPSRRTVVNFFALGTAIFGFDYLLFGDSDRVVIPAGQSSATLTLHAIADDRPEFNETAIIRVEDGRRYKPGFPTQAKLVIDNVP
jgi:hypothetical protein